MPHPANHTAARATVAAAQAFQASTQPTTPGVFSAQTSVSPFSYGSAFGQPQPSQPAPLPTRAPTQVLVQPTDTQPAVESESERRACIVFEELQIAFGGNVQPVDFVPACT